MGMFDKAAKVAAPAKAVSKGVKKFELAIPGVEPLSMIDALQKTLETLRGTFEGEVKAAASAHFMEHIARTGQRPDSFNGVEGGATATLVLGRKASTHPLSDAAVAVMREHELEPVKTIVTPELFAINPACMSRSCCTARCAGFVITCTCSTCS